MPFAVVPFTVAAISRALIHRYNASAKLFNWIACASWLDDRHDLRWRMCSEASLGTGIVPLEEISSALEGRPCRGSVRIRKLSRFGVIDNELRRRI